MAKKRTTRQPRGTQARQTAPRSPEDEAGDLRYRVWKIDQGLKEAVTEKRNQQNTTIRDFVRDSVQQELPALVEALGELGIAIGDASSIGPVRWPMEEATMSALRQASTWTGLDQSQLIVACLRLATRRKRRRSS